MRHRRAHIDEPPRDIWTAVAHLGSAAAPIGYVRDANHAGQRQRAVRRIKLPPVQALPDRPARAVRLVVRCQPHLAVAQSRRPPPRDRADRPAPGGSVISILNAVASKLFIFQLFPRSERMN